MVHYGHYVFRSPPPLAILDPGIDAVTGQTLFLEGHHQNTAMFADERAKARTGGFGTLTVAKFYQLFMPLLLIAIGHGVLIRERENKTLGTLMAQGITGPQIMLGKGLALFAMGALLTLPALFLSIYAMFQGEAMGVGFVIYASYVLFLTVWVSLIILISVNVRTRALALGTLLLIWFATSLIIPRMGVAVSSAFMPVDGKFQTDMKMARDIRALGDGHNAADPAFAKLKANILAQYDVEAVEDLPINFRGVAAEFNEKELTDVMNRYAETRMHGERRQSRMLKTLSIISPFVAIDNVSRSLAGTDLSTHHRFLREAEAIRYDFVQGLNAVHVTELAYSDDIKRSSDAASEKRTRISADNWSVLDDFRFMPDPAQKRLLRSSFPLMSLILWFLLLAGASVIKSRRLTP